MHPSHNLSPSPSARYYHHYHHTHHHHPLVSAYSTLPDQYLATSGGDNFPGTFSRGSSLAYPHEDCQRLDTDRGGFSGPSPQALSSSSSSMAFATSGTPVDSLFGANGLGFTETTAAPPAGPPSASGREYDHYPEDIPGLYHCGQGWQWDYHSTAHVASGPSPLPPPLSYAYTHPHPPPHLHLPPLPQLHIGASGALPPDPAFLDLTTTIKSAVTVGQPSHPYPALHTPTAQLPTPAAMAVLLNPKGRRKEHVPQLEIDVALSNQQPPTIQMSPAVADAMGMIPVPESLSREKKHACTMCHKRFDRPSTLRKHLLVHTGEKAFVCDTCGRRFGVASNLNRHVRRCILKPVNVVTSSVSDSPPEGGSGAPLPVRGGDQDSGKAGAAKRGRALSSTGSTSSSSSTLSSSANGQRSPNDEGIEKQQEKPPGQKRRRRAPSPSLWIPWSLRTFNLACEEYYWSTPVPLPPVHRNLPKEERDSWDENVSSTPYHPQEWKEVLPGPGLGHGIGLGGKDVRNINFGGSGGIMLGRVLVF